MDAEALLTSVWWTVEEVVTYGIFYWIFYGITKGVGYVRQRRTE